MNRLKRLANHSLPTGYEMIVNESGGIPNRLFFRLFQTGNILQRQVQNEMGISAVQ